MKTPIAPTSPCQETSVNTTQLTEVADIGRQVWTSVHDDVALPPLALTHVVED
jgi:hypothetical protein